MWQSGFYCTNKCKRRVDIPYITFIACVIYSLLTMLYRYCIECVVYECASMSLWSYTKHLFQLENCWIQNDSLMRKQTKRYTQTSIENAQWEVRWDLCRVYMIVLRNRKIAWNVSILMVVCWNGAWHIIIPFISIYAIVYISKRFHTCVSLFSIRGELMFASIIITININIGNCNRTETKRATEKCLASES